jgi:excisionase family DNA binding protein
MDCNDTHNNDKQSVIFNNRIWFSSREAANYLSISVANLRVRVSRGEIPVDGKLGRTLRFRRDKLDELLESFKHKGGLYD